VRNKRHIQNEIIKLRKLVNLKAATPMEQEKAWCSMLALQWALQNERKPGHISPVIICKPNLFRWELK